MKKLECRMKMAQDGQSGFTLLEVIVACAIFFMVAFAILSVVTQGLAAARNMRNKEPDIGMALVASGIPLSIAVSNTLATGISSGDFEELFPGIYNGYSWQVETVLVGSNGLWRADITLYKNAGKKGVGEVKTSVLLHARQSNPSEMPVESIFNPPREF